MTGIIGSLSRIDDVRGTVHVEDEYATTPEDLWSALTDPVRLARWIATVEGDLRPGGTITASFTSGWDGPARIDVCNAPHRLVVTLEPGTDDETVIEALVSPAGTGARLVVEERGLPIGVLAAHGAGWQAHLEDLQHHLDGGDSQWRERWTALTPEYEALEIRA